MIYSYTQIAQYLRCPRSYRHRYLDGWREKDNRPALLFGCCFEQALAAFLHRRTAPRHFSMNGINIKTLTSNIPAETAGKGYFVKEFSCSNDWPKMIVFRFAIRRRTCKLSCSDRFQMEANSLPTSMPWEISTANPVCLNGRRLQHGIPKNLTGCSLLILS